MSIITILGEFVILFVCCIIQTIGIILEGISMLCCKLVEYLCIAYEGLGGLLKKMDNKH